MFSLRLATAVFLFFLLNNFAQADALYDKCMDEKPFGTNPEWAECGSDYVERADKQLNAIWKIVLNSYENHPQKTEIRKNLIDEQRAWIVYKANICDIFSSGYWGREGEVIRAPQCEAKLIEDRIDELRRFYCFEDKCGFDKIAEPAYADFDQAKTILDHLNSPIQKELSQEDEEELKSEEESMAEYGLNAKEDTARDQERFQLYRENACGFIDYLENTVDKGFIYENCLKTIFEHRIEQITNVTHLGSESDIPHYANLGTLFQQADWIFGCDQSFTCTAIGYPNIDNVYVKGQYIRIRWQYNSDTSPSIRFVVASRDKNITADSLNYHFANDKTVFPLIYGKANFPVLISAEISPQDSIAFFNLLLKEESLTFGIDHKGLPQSILDLKTFAKFYNAQKENVERLYADQSIQLPVLGALRFSINEIMPDNIDKVTSTCPNTKKNRLLKFNMRNNNIFFASCTNFGDSKNTAYTLQLETSDKLEPATFDAKTNWKKRILINNLEPMDNELELHSVENFSSNNDCGHDYGYAYDGVRWNLSSYKTMPKCAFIQREDWPVLYKTQLNEKTSTFK